MSRKKRKPSSQEEKSTAQEVENPMVDEIEAQDAQEANDVPEETIDVDKLQADLAQAASQREEYLNLAQRVQADFDNFRRRNANLRSEAFDDGAKAFATTLLPVIDNLERAVDSAKASTDTALLAGVELVLKQMLEAFEKRGITPIDRLGEKFDPNLENAVIQGSADEGEPGTVCQVLQKGYHMEGKAVLRHAMVKVVAE